MNCFNLSSGGYGLAVNAHKAKKKKVVFTETCLGKTWVCMSGIFFFFFLEVSPNQPVARRLHGLLPAGWH